MYKDFTNSAEAMRQERYRLATTTSTRSLGRGIQIRIGHALMKMGERLLDSPVARTPIGGTSA